MLLSSGPEIWKVNLLVGNIVHVFRLGVHDQVSRREVVKLQAALPAISFILNLETPLSMLIRKTAGAGALMGQAINP